MLLALRQGSENGPALLVGGQGKLKGFWGKEGENKKKETMEGKPIKKGRF